MNQESDYVGFWITIFVNRTAIEEAKNFFKNELALHIIEDTTFNLKHGQVWVDEQARSWVTDTVTFQYLCNLPSDDAESKYVSDLEKFISKDRESLIGATGLEIRTIIGDAPIPAQEATVFATTIGPVELSLKKLATHETLLSMGRATLRIPMGINPEAQTNFRRENARRYLLGLEGELVIPQLLGHKVGWLARQTEVVLIQDNLNQLPVSVLAALKSITSRLQDNSPKASKLNEVMIEIVKLTETESLLAINAHQLRIQQEHLRHHIDRGMCKDLFSVYLSICNTSMNNVVRHIEQINRLNSCLSNASSVARLNLEERRNVSIRYTEGMLAAIGLGIAVIALFESELVIHFGNWLFGYTLSKDSMSGSALTFIVRTSLAVLCSIVTWNLIVKPQSLNSISDQRR